MLIVLQLQDCKEIENNRRSIGRQHQVRNEVLRGQQGFHWLLSVGFGKPFGVVRKHKQRLGTGGIRVEVVVVGEGMVPKHVLLQPDKSGVANPISTVREECIDGGRLRESTMTCIYISNSTHTTRKYKLEQEQLVAQETK